MNNPACRIAVLVSGSGSNLQAIMDASASGQINGQVVAVFSNRPGVKGLTRAEDAGIPAEVVDHKQFDSRESFDRQMIEAIDSYQPDLVVLAGFMRVLTEGFVDHYYGRLLNIHPSRLPKYRGLHTHQRALDAGDKEHGASTHFVSAELDGGPVILQSRLEILDDHTPDSLASDLLKQEHVIYPLTVQWFCEGRIHLQGDKVVFDNEMIAEPVQLDDIL